MGHWYKPDGSPLYTIIGANGKERDTTLRDARKLNLSPSVTTVMSMAAKPGLDQYLQTQLLDAVASIGVHDSDFWRQSVIQKSKEHSQNAASKGTVIHDALEQYFLGNYEHGFPANLEAICLPVVTFLDKTFGNIKWSPERSFSHNLGFGGKVDMSFDDGAFPAVLDFKTKDTNDIKKMVAYDEHGMQTAAYAVGLDIPTARRYNLFISTQVPGLLSLTESIDFERDWGMFESLLKFWQLKNRYKPEV